jgi:hypothetical protein
MTFEVGDKAWLSTWNIKTTMHSKIENNMWSEPYMVSKVINKNADKIDLPRTICMYNVFHISLLDRYSPPIIGQ